MLKVKTFLILIFLITISCNSQDKDKKELTSTKQAQKLDITSLFLNKKYFNKYDLDPNSKFPQYNKTDKEIGYFQISFIGKTKSLQEEWFDYGTKNNIFYEAEPDENYLKKINFSIKKKLDHNFNNYYIIAEYVEPKYLDKNLDFIYPYSKHYYFYDTNKKEWIFLKQIIVDNSQNEKNITKIEDLNSYIFEFLKNNKILSTKTNTMIDHEEAKALAQKQFDRQILDIIKSNTEATEIGAMKFYIGDLTNDQIDDIVIYYSLSPENGGNAIIQQGLFVYQNTGDDVKFIEHIQPDYLFSFNKIYDNKISLIKLEFSEEDNITPSLKTEVLIKVKK